MAPSGGGSVPVARDSPAQWTAQIDPEEADFFFGKVSCDDVSLEHLSKRGAHLRLCRVGVAGGSARPSALPVEMLLIEMHLCNSGVARALVRVEWRNKISERRTGA